MSEIPTGPDAGRIAQLISEQQMPDAVQLLSEALSGLETQDARLSAVVALTALQLGEAQRELLAEVRQLRQQLAEQNQQLQAHVERAGAAHQAIAQGLKRLGVRWDHLHLQQEERQAEVAARTGNKVAEHCHHDTRAAHQRILDEDAREILNGCEHGTE